MVAHSLNCPMEQKLREGRVKVAECPTVGDEYLVELITEEVMKAIMNGFDIVAIDSVTPLMKILGTYAKKRSWLHTVIYKIASMENVNVFLVCDTLLREDPDVSLLEYLADVVVKLDYRPDSIFPRSLRITKFRTKPVLPIPVYFDISPMGVRAINIVDEGRAERLRSLKPPLRISEDPVSKLFGSELPPGTQVSIIVKHPASGTGLLHKYLVLKLGLESLRNDLNIALIYYGKEKPHIIKEESLAGKVLGDKFIEVPSDINLRQMPCFLMNKSCSPEKLWVLVVSGVEKLVESYGLKELNNMLTVYHTVDSKLGITSIRVFRTNPSVPNPPSAMMTLSDVIIDVSLNEDRGCYNLRVVKGRHALRPITILDTELGHVIESLRREFMAEARRRGLIGEGGE